MEVHPGIVFRSGSAGRRPGLAGGPDIWEIARIFQQVESRGDEAVQQTVRLTGLSPEQVRVALYYYGNYQAEIDDWIRRVDEEADRAEAAWQRTRDLLQRGS